LSIQEWVKAYKTKNKYKAGKEKMTDKMEENYEIILRMD